MDGVEFVGLLELVDMVEVLKLGGPVGVVLEMILTDLKGTVLDSGANEVVEDDGREYKGNKDRLPVLASHDGR